jgi:acyl transferase domain-containing protein/NAD(P)H-dependent flavin oxidoreductase YrpB (nitropropane dioxygenase family)
LGVSPIEQLGRLGRLTSGAFGVFLTPREVLDGCVVKSDIPRLEVVCVPVRVDDEERLDRVARLIRQTGRIAVSEVTTREGARRAMRAGFTAVVVSGHEAGGRGGAESSFVLLQGVAADAGLPVWVRGGIGPNVAAGCIAAGAAGVVLEGALLLARESPLSLEWRQRIACWDGSETTSISPAAGPAVRVFALAGSNALARLKKAAGHGGKPWDAAVGAEVGWQDGQCIPVGQDSAFADCLARKYVTVGGIVQAFERAILDGIAAARSARPLAEGSPLAVAHRTRYPIVQGPMTRVSDVVEFALAVAEGGGLPFLALALLREAEVRTMLRDAAAQLAGVPWGVGILGFVPPDLRAEQLAAVRDVRPPLALIAGGRPEQAAGLEREGITTYLHVPSPGLLEQYLRDGCRRFVLEGRECGGHVGPRSSFVLWEQAVVMVSEAIDRGMPAEDVSLVFAGGLHDARSAALAAALAGPLAARGVKLGVLAGTAYLFTQEAVTTGAIVPRFQAEVLRCRETVLLESGPGHQVRVSPTPFAGRFEEERQRLVAQGRPIDEIRAALESLNAGRLRVATKGVDRSHGAGTPLVAVDDDYQATNGLYMLGQVAALRSRTTSIAALHHELCTESAAVLEQAARENDLASDVAGATARPSDIAIIGMEAVFPGAASVTPFWSNTIQGTDTITEVPPDRWDWRLYYDPDPKAPDKIVSKWGGFVPDIAFDPLRYGMPPSSLPSIEPAQLIALEVVRRALADAGYAERPFPKEQTAVVLGMGGGAAQLAMGFAFRSYLPMLDTVLPDGGLSAIESCKGLLPEWTEDSFPGFLLNVTAGRIANRLNLGGSSYTVDAACGSSLAAAALAVRELETGAADMVVLGGVDTVQNPFTYLAFSKTQAFSPRGRCRPFDSGADGIVISEGVAALVLKRLADAERDGDRIYAVIKAVGSSSDGRARGLTAPVVEGQSRALERAYARAGVSPATVGYVEAHGTGTALGDVVEIEALGRLFQNAGAPKRGCVVGSVKSSIGHTKCAAGLAGLINASLSLYHKVVPPTIGIETPNPKLDLQDGPFRLCTQAQPWLHPHHDRPRRAGVSAFGFGGTNFHAVLEEYDHNLAAGPESTLGHWPVELLVWRAEDAGGIAGQLDELAAALDSGARPSLCDLAAALFRGGEMFLSRSGGNRGSVVAIVASSHEDLREKLKLAGKAIIGGISSFDDPRGVVFEARPMWAGAPVAFVFPGQGAQSPGMLRELAVLFPEVHQAFEEFDRVLAVNSGQALGPLIFPSRADGEEAWEKARRALTETDVAQPAMGAACVGMLRLLRSLGFEPDLVGGHSYGELVALHAAGVLGAVELAELSSSRGRLMREAGHGVSGAMAALLAGPIDTDRLVGEVPGVQVANWNGPRQTVIAGPMSAVQAALDLAGTRGIHGRLLPVSSAFHTPLVAGARQGLRDVAAGLLRESPDRPVYSNLDAAPHPADPRSIAARLGDHLASPVRFTEMIEAMYSDGARVFVEVGPGSILAPLVETILGGRPHLAVACEASGASGLAVWLRSAARLAAAGLPLALSRLTRGRSQRVLDLRDLPQDENPEPATPSTWLVNGSRARPIGDPEPKRLGQANVRPRPQPDRGSRPSARSNAPFAGKSVVSGLYSSKSPSSGHPAAAVGKRSTGARPLPPRSVSGRNGDGNTDTHRAVASSSSRSQAHDRVIESFQQTMQAFLEVQQTTMLAYLSGRGSPGSAERLLARPEPEGRSHDDASRLASPPLSRKPRWDEALVEGINPGNGQVVAGNLGSPGDDAPVSARDHPNGVDSATMRSAPDRAAITARMLETVRDRTGYPIETLGLDLDMEADLGIDSIKRVEILGKLRDSFPSLKGLSDSAETMDALIGARTLRMIVDRMSDLAQQSLASGEGPACAQAPGAIVAIGSNGKPHHTTLRRLLETVEAPLPGDRLTLMPGGRILITDDGHGVAGSLAQILEHNGMAVERIGGDPEPVDWTSTSVIETVLGRLRSRGPLAGIIHALPLREARGGGLTKAEWSGRDELKGLFLLAKAAAADLDLAARAGGSCLIAATSLGGRFASAGCTTRDFFPGHGGIAGLVKTLAREWPRVRCRVVDFAASDPVEALAGRLADELLVRDGWAEVGYAGERRIRLRTTTSPLLHEAAAIELAPGERVLISGGARGITALVAAELARIWRPTLLIVGTTPLPSQRESADTVGLEDESEIKAALHARLRQEGSPASPAQIEAVFQSLRRAREVRKNLELLREAGSTVAYAEADVRDPLAMAKVLDGWRALHGEPVGLIHGAGLIKDKLIRHKTVESFDRVMETKLDGARNLIRLANPEALKFTVLFSSIAGRFGNVGQSDYAAANETLNKLAHWLDRRWPGRVLSVIWGPWSGVGMVSNLESHLGRRGLGMISPDEGPSLLIDELRHGRKGDVEVIYAGELGTLEVPISHEPAVESLEAVR